MSSNLPTNIAIENVIQSKMRGREAYQGFVSSQVAVTFSYSPSLILLRKCLSLLLLKAVFLNIIVALQLTV
ncbi:hypothetical protein [Lysinibacillus xylanilyticus]|uniref:hypothetical protein n=1 Tax=Lysinibacillus xylanilyticus TaxID=582475 RepID=UPI00381019F2